MLEGVRANDIIVGAYTDRRGGVCPMLAAHRNGGRTDFLSFARAWDRFAKAGKRSRRATPREIRVLVAHLEASLLEDSAIASDLRHAIAEHRELVDRRTRREAEEASRRRVRPGDPDRSGELGGRQGWRWLRPFRRLDDYERAMAMVEREAEAERDEQRERELV
jgi:hypothetical protein